MTAPHLSRARLLRAAIFAMVVGAVAALVGSAQAATIPASFAASSGALSLPLVPVHTCSGVVLRTPERDLIATAAHCISGSGVGYRFTPGLTNGKAPSGSWTTSRAWIDPAWRSGTSNTRDLAILRVAPRTIGGRSTKIGELIGGATLGHAPAAGTEIWASGYVLGFGGSATTCKVRTALAGPWPTFDCAGFSAGVSGGPWYDATSDAEPRLVGLTSGLNQGGCTPERSYSVALGAWSDALLARARAGAPGDRVPRAPATAANPRPGPPAHPPLAGSVWGRRQPRLRACWAMAEEPEPLSAPDRDLMRLAARDAPDEFLMTLQVMARQRLSEQVGLLVNGMIIVGEISDPEVLAALMQVRRGRQIERAERPEGLSDAEWDEMAQSWIDEPVAMIEDQRRREAELDEALEPYLERGTRGRARSRPSWNAIWRRRESPHTSRSPTSRSPLRASTRPRTCR